MEKYRKKSQLRHIIRESIKELMTEQTSNARSHTVHTCIGSGGATGLIRNLTVDNQVPVNGQYFNCADLGSAGGILSNWPANVAAGNFCRVGTEKPQYLVGGQTDVTSLGSGGCPSSQAPGCGEGTNTSPCASQWFQNPNASWAANWMNNRDCSNYTWPANNLETQALAIMAGAPNPQPNVYNGWQDIWSAGQNSGLPNAAQFVSKMAKAKFSQCQKQACNC